MNNAPFSSDAAGDCPADMFVNAPPELILKLVESVYTGPAAVYGWKDPVMRLARALIYPLCHRRDRGELQLSQRVIRRHLPLTEMAALWLATEAGRRLQAGSGPLGAYLAGVPGFDFALAATPELWDAQVYQQHGFLMLQFIQVMEAFNQMYGRSFPETASAAPGVPDSSATEARRAMLGVRIREDLKQQAEAVLEKLGLNATDAVTRLYRYLAEHRRMPVTERIYTYQHPSGTSGGFPDPRAAAPDAQRITGDDVNGEPALPPAPSRQLTTYITGLSAMLLTFDITCDFWPLVDAEFRRRSGGAERDCCICVALLARWPLEDQRHSLHQKPRKSDSRRRDIASGLYEEYGFQMNEALQLIDGISERAQTPADFIRALEEHHVYCTDDMGLLAQYEPRHPGPMDARDYQFPLRLAAAIEEISFFYEDGHPGTAQGLKDLQLLLTRDFRFSPDAATSFVSRISPSQPG